MRAAGLAGLVLLAAQVAGAAEPRRYAVVIGANEGGSEDGLLRYATRDAERMGTVLRQLGGVYEEDLVQLSDPSPERVRRVLREVASRVDEDASGSVLFVYYSGHADATGLHLAGETLAFEEIVRQIDAIPTDVRVLVVDACKSGSLTRVKGGTPTDAFEIRVPAPARSHGTAIITSSSGTEDAQESERLRGGVFTHHFITGLLGAADASRDRQVTLQEAYSYGHAETIRTTSQARFIQRPSYSFELRGEDGLVLTRLDGGRRTGDLVVEDAGEYVLFEEDAEGVLIADARLESGGALTLPSGDYWVRARDIEGVRQGQVRIETDAATALNRQDLSAVSPARSVRKGYDLSRRVALGVFVGGGMTGPARPQLGTMPVGYIGARIDGSSLSGLVRLRYSGARVANSDIKLAEDLVGLDITALRLFDIGPISPGLGVRGGVDVVQQRFTTDGRAPSRESLVGRAGPVLRVDAGLGRGSLISLAGALDIVVQRQASRDDTVSLQSTVVPSLTLEWTLYAR